MEYRPQEIKAGIMVVLSFIILIVFLVAISGLDLFKSTKQYLARFNYISGLEVGSLVRYGGMEVGKIENMRISENNNSQIEFVLEVDNNVPVKTNSKATIASIGLMGEFHINISTGHPDSSLVPAGSLLNCEDVPPLMQLMEPIGEIADQIKETLSTVRQILGKDNQDELHSIFVNLNKLLGENQKNVNILIKNLSEVILNFNRMSTKVDRLLTSNEENISNSVTHLEETLVRTKKLMKNIDKMMVDLDHVVLTKGNDINEIMKNLSRTTNNLEEFSRSIKEQPWQLIRKSAPKERKIN